MDRPRLSETQYHSEITSTLKCFPAEIPVLGTAPKGRDAALRLSQKVLLDRLGGSPASTDVSERYEMAACLEMSAKASNRLEPVFHWQRGNRGCGGLRTGTPTPALVEHSQVQRGAQQRPLCAHPFQPPHRPAPESVVLFDLRKARFNDFTSALPLRLRRGRLPSGSHGLHCSVVRPHFNLFGLWDRACSVRAPGSRDDDSEIVPRIARFSWCGLHDPGSGFADR